MDPQYIGEHLWPGQIGQFALLLALVGALFGALSYALGVSDPDNRWRKMGRVGYGLLSIGTCTLIGLIFYIMVERYYEYHYVFSHVSDDLPMRYILSAFWEGQEGSFLLWIFWHMVLGGVVIIQGGRWEAPVLSVLLLLQAVLLSMIVGIYIGDYRMGSNPLMLTREVMDLPLFQQADYLIKLAPFAEGLNPLLQNYWNTIHPPVTFLGFASVSMPFCYAMAGLWRRDYKGWLVPGQQWALFSGAALGTGVLMGAAWAYEALSFGGYWAWDPVENMSLVPWMILVAGIHTHVVARATGRSLKITFVLYALSFVLVLYSTFLTRSGILGDTSAHAFTEMGLEWQLVGMLALFALLGLGMVTYHWRHIPEPTSESPINTRETWMFIGSLVLMFGAFLITFSTSLPVFNAIVESFRPGFEGWVIEDPEQHHNDFQLFVAVLIGLLSGIAQFLYFRRNTDQHFRIFWRTMGALVLVSILSTFLLSRWIDISTWRYALLLFAAAFAIISNLWYFIGFANRNPRTAGSVLSHIGFGLLIIGVLASGLNKHFLFNPTIQRVIFEGGDPNDIGKNNTLIKNKPLYMSGYEVTYLGDTLRNQTLYFTIHFKKLDERGQFAGEEFTLYPHVIYNKPFTAVAAVNPDTRHYLHRDIFTSIAGLPEELSRPADAHAKHDSADFKTYHLSYGDTLFGAKAYAIVHPLYQSAHAEYVAQAGDVVVAASLLLYGNGDLEPVDTLHPMLVMRQGQLLQYLDMSDALGFKVRLPQEAMQTMIPHDSTLQYQEYALQAGDTFWHGGLRMIVQSINPNPNHAQYVPEGGDVAVSAVVEVWDEQQQQTEVLEPVYLIRGENRVFNLKDVHPTLGLHVRFVEIRPEDTSGRALVLAVAKEAEFDNKVLPFEVADDLPETDFIALQAIVFPGIQLVWLGSAVMLLGLVCSLLYKKREKKLTGMEFVKKS